MFTWSWVLGFGIIGVGSRFAVDSWIVRWGFSFPFGTLFINILGSLIAGFCIGIGVQKNLAEEPVRLGIIVGFCGGFTTMSGYGLQFVQLLNDGKVAHALAYGVGSPALCILSVVSGLFLGRML
jgi:CrcB protein